ncbi:uncharacterized protein LOC122011633 [Zingiber officinale]|uniref:Transmembrane protein n=1 Tax=Zingiber officinale TaxID=94328 RepID=A0A8J5FMD2_ZINOF|nr:uncharacterized protein LOC122011633 [Zingiber officinale]KAG6486982.1 hypothetical protein ZIOFF_055563 [Zingiber officinale]
MKNSGLQTPRRTPRPAIHGGGRPKETPPLLPKVVSRRLSLPFSTVSEETLDDCGDLLDFPPEANSIVEDPTDISDPLPIESEEEGSHGSSNTIVRTVAEQEIRPEELVDRLRKDLRELMESTDVKGRSETLLCALLEAIESTRCEEDPRWDSVKVSIGIVCFLVLLVAAIDLLVVWEAVIARRDFSSLPPPT